MFFYKQQQQQQQPVLAFLFILGLFSALFCYVSLKTNDAPYLENGWEYSWSEAGVAPPAVAVWYPMDFPGQPPGRNGHNALWLRVNLPEKPLQHPALYAKFIRQSYELYLDNRLIHQYTDPGLADKRRFSPFFPWHLVILPEDAPGKILYFHIHSTGPSIGILGTVQYAPLLAILSDRATLDLFKTTSAVLALFLGIAAFALYLRDRTNKLYLAFAGSAIVGAVLVFSGTFAAMLIVNNVVFWSQIVAISGLYWPVLLLTFLFHLAGDHYQSYFRVLIRFGMAFATISLGLFWWDPTLIKLIYLASFPIHYINYVVILYVLRNKLRVNQEAQIYCIGSTVWLAALSYDVLVVMNIFVSRTTMASLGQLAEMSALAAILLLRYLAMQHSFQQNSLELSLKNADLLMMQARLESLNHGLEETVATRTHDLTVQKACLQQLFEKSPDATSLLTDDYRIINVNSAFEQLFLVSREAVIGRSIQDFITFPDVKDVKSEAAAIRTALAAGDTVQVDTRCQLADGRWLYVMLTAYSFITDVDTNGIYMIYRDISARKETEKLLKDSEKQYRLLAENTSDVIWLMDERMNLLYVSPSIEKLLGFTAAEVMCLPHKQRAFPLPAADMSNLIESCSRPDSSYQFPVLIEKQLQNNTTGAVWTESLINIARNEAGQKMGYLGTTRNIHERKQTQELLSLSYERKKVNDFFQTILHSPTMRETDMYFQALRSNIQLPQQFSLYVLSIGGDHTAAQPSQTDIQTKILIDTIIDQLNAQETTIAWEFAENIGVIYPCADLPNRTTEERNRAECYLRWLDTQAPGMQFKIGIAEYASGLANFSLRFKHAQAAIKTGILVWPDRAIYHFENCGIYQILTHYADSTEAAAYVERTLGPLLEYDRINNTNLMLTLEKILISPTLKEVADQLFFHHKTILARKQRIETILQASLDSFETRMTLGAAIHIAKLLPAKDL